MEGFFRRDQEAAGDGAVVRYLVRYVDFDEGKKVAAALSDAIFVYHSGGRWPQVSVMTYVEHRTRCSTAINFLNFRR